MFKHLSDLCETYRDRGRLTTTKSAEHQSHIRNAIKPKVCHVKQVMPMLMVEGDILGCELEIRKELNVSHASAYAMHSLD
jgi:hypothetical protein